MGHHSRFWQLDQIWLLIRSRKRSARPIALPLRRHHRQGTHTCNLEHSSAVLWVYLKRNQGQNSHGTTAAQQHYLHRCRARPQQVLGPDWGVPRRLPPQQSRTNRSVNSIALIQGLFRPKQVLIHAAHRMHWGRTELRGRVLSEHFLCEKFRGAPAEPVLHLDRWRTGAVPFRGRLQPKVDHQWRLRPADSALRREQAGTARFSQYRSGTPREVAGSWGDPLDQQPVKLHVQRSSGNRGGLPGPFRNKGGTACPGVPHHPHQRGHPLERTRGNQLQQLHRQRGLGTARVHLHLRNTLHPLRQPPRSQRHQPRHHRRHLIDSDAIVTDRSGGMRTVLQEQPEAGEGADRTETVQTQEEQRVETDMIVYDWVMSDSIWRNEGGVGSFYRGDWLQVGYVSHWRLCCTLGQVRTHGVAPLLHSTWRKWYSYSDKRVTILLLAFGSSLDLSSVFEPTQPPIYQSE